MITVKIKGGYRCVFGPIEATGRTKTEAKERALTEAEKRLMLAGSPMVIRHHDYYAIIYYHAKVGAWADAILFPDYEPDSRGYVRLATYADWDSKERAERDARMQLAQFTMDGSIIVNEQDKKEFSWWFAWQRAYREAQEKGLKGEDARRYASEHEQEFRTVEVC